MAQGVTVTTMKIKDAEAIGRHPNVRGYYLGQLTQEVASHDMVNKTVMIWGVSAPFFDLYQAKVMEGRSFTNNEDKSQSRVVVIGPALKKKLFGDGKAIGERLKIGDKKFMVIGVMEEQGNYFGVMDMDNVVYMPVRTLQKQIMGIDHIQWITAYLRDPGLAKNTALDLIQIMRTQHNITDPQKDDFAVTTMDEALAMLGTVTGGITLLLAAIAAISLVVGGVGIMNIMYISVSERTFEIGLRKAVGATKSNILWQFLWEAIFLTFTGGLIGVFLGTFFSFISSVAAEHMGYNWGFYFWWPGLILGVCFSLATGLIFGLYPASQAAKLEPVEALRYE
jgi:putative ABC transport system permease protein